MNIILHRINTIELLNKTPINFGVEIDIRSNSKDLILHHDPFSDGELFKNWLKFYNHGTLILNVKEEGLEHAILKLMKKNKIKNYFFLDQSFPFLRKTAIEGESRCAVRVSEYEDINTALALSGMVDWVWVDCFSVFPLKKNDFNILKDAGFNLCFVSPELQGYTDKIYVEKFRKNIDLLGIKGDSVCTKYPDLWV
ncbi:hypothetical protein N9M18_02300 [Candidatus Pseudothioglobus singularis]|nr:hypothetical protein [Candidatus Pseudothioglobus singularis]